MNPIYDVAILAAARRASSPPMSWPTTAPA